MKVFSASALLGVFTLGLVSYLPTPVQACEHECQVNVSHAFADKYQTLSNEYFTLLTQKVEESLFYGIPVITILSTEETTRAAKTFQDSIQRAQMAWDVSLFPTVFDTIFKDEPKFKGDCNNPRLVKQPPLGVNWTMSDCHKMDYICGNPPSICHFLPMIKHRIASKLIVQLHTELDEGNDSDIYANYLKPALDTIMTDQPSLNVFSGALHGNLNQILETVRNHLTAFANDRTQWK
ncbi:hypothetical protein BGZ65_007680, partial [Modicella reniformis]